MARSRAPDSAPLVGRPLVGVSGPDRGGWPAWFWTRLMVFMAGGRALRITPSHPHADRAIDALIIGGGADVDPSLYKEEILRTVRIEARRARRLGLEFFLGVFMWLVRKLFSLPSGRRGDRARDELEVKLLKVALKRGIPVLGICRGAQLINVHFGGSLHQDISGFYTERPQLRTILPKKRVTIERGSRLFEAVEHRPELRVNSLHRQSVKMLGEGLRSSAVEENGVIQAIEHVDMPCILGVQWHPELLPLKPAQRALFRWLVGRAVARRNGEASVPPSRTQAPVPLHGPGQPPPSSFALE